MYTSFNSHQTVCFSYSSDHEIKNKNTEGRRVGGGEGESGFVLVSL